MIYEIMYIVPSMFSDTEIDGITKTVNAYYEKHGAEVKKTENLGKLKLAYTIKGVTHGTYILNFIEAAGESVAKIDQELRLAEQVLRHLVVKREDGIPTYPITLVPYQAPVAATGKRSGKERGEKGAEGEVAAPAAAVAPAAEISLDSVNEKLDEILGADTTEA